MAFMEAQKRFSVSSENFSAAPMAWTKPAKTIAKAVRRVNSSEKSLETFATALNELASQLSHCASRFTASASHLRDLPIDLNAFADHFSGPVMRTAIQVRQRKSAERHVPRSNKRNGREGQLSMALS